MLLIDEKAECLRVYKRCGVFELKKERVLEHHLEDDFV